jgi:hypothetical protein
LPGELLKKIKESLTEENRPQFGYVRLGSLDYFTFGELLTLLQQESGRPVAEKVGGACVLKQLENVFVPRNAICHSRPVSSVGLKTIEALYAEMETALAADGFRVRADHFIRSRCCGGWTSARSRLRSVIER